MDVVVLIARIVLLPVFLSAGLGFHLGKGRAQAVPYSSAKGVPAAGFLVPLSGVQIVVGSLMVTLGVWPDLGALLLVAFLVPTAFLMHGFWKETDAMAKITEQAQFFKDLGLAAGALFAFALFATVGDDLGLMLTGPLFDLNL